MMEGTIAGNNGIRSALLYAGIMTALFLGVIAGYAAGVERARKAELGSRAEELLLGAVNVTGIYGQSYGFSSGRIGSSQDPGIFFRESSSGPLYVTVSEFARSYAWCYLTAIAPAPVWLAVAWGISIYRRRREEHDRSGDGGMFFALEEARTILADAPREPVLVGAAVGDLAEKPGMGRAHAGTNINTAHIKSEFLKKMINELRVKK